MARRKIRNKESAYLVRAFRSMPEVSHKCTILPDGTVDLSESELIKWALTNTDILNYIGHRAMSSPYTVFDPTTGKWKGINNDLTVEEARRVSDEEIKMNSSDWRTEENQRKLERAFDELEKHTDNNGREYVPVGDLVAEFEVSERTIQRWVAKSVYFFCDRGRVYEKK